jgi:hypothetical protein
VSPVVDLILVLVLMPVVGYALIGAWRGAQWLAEARRKPPAPVPVERLAGDLRRLRAELADTETRDGLTAKQHRVRALRAAYLDALATACERLGVELPWVRAAGRGGGVPLAEIYRVEAALRDRGLDVREPAAR